MDIRIEPSSLSGIIKAPASKSDAHRRIICAALANAPSRLSVDALSRDIERTFLCVKALGARVEDEGDNVYRITPVTKEGPHALLDCSESGSTLRFLLPVAAALRNECSFMGSGRLPERPMEALVDSMKAHGCVFSEKSLPFSVSGKLKGGVFTLPGNISSQFISGLLLAAPLMDEGVKILLTTELESRAYVDMTIQTMRSFGVDVVRNDDGFEVAKGSRYRAVCDEIMGVEGDWSNAAFWLSGAAISGEVEVLGLSETSVQGDKAILDILKRFGANVRLDPQSVGVSKNRLCAIELDVSEIPDLMPVVSAVAAYAEGKTRIYNASRLRLKESDRLHEMGRCLRAMGADVRELQDAIEIKGQKALCGGTLDSAGDHRIAMAAAIAALRADGPVTIQNAQAVDKSYPRFFEDYVQLGGKAYVI